MHLSSPRRLVTALSLFLWSIGPSACSWQSAQAQDVGAIGLFELDGSVPIRRVTVGSITDPEGVPAIAASTRLAYSNTLGRFAAELPAGQWIADDLTLIADNQVGHGLLTCGLRRFSFQVTGRPNPAGCDDGSCGPFSVEFALFDACPGAGGQVITGTEGIVSFDDDGTYEVGVIIPSDVEVLVPSRVWLRLRMSRARAAVILGAPALTGFSGDVLDLLGFACALSTGGFPRFPHASFNAEVYVDADCSTGFPGYQNIRAANAGLNAGTNVCLADDIRMHDRCAMVALEVGVRNKGLYDVGLRASSGNVPIGPCADLSGFRDYSIPGTWKRFLVSRDGLAIRRFAFDPPVPLPDEQLWVVLMMNNANAQWILTKRNAAIGETKTTYAKYDSSDGWQLKLPVDNSHAGLHAVITCAGEPPVGACCDQYIRDENDEAVCRVLPRLNCPFPLKGSSLDPDWVEGATCDPQPFDHPCGLSACCTPDGGCANLTKNECNALEPLDRPRVWDLGEFCAEGAQECPIVACLEQDGDCMFAGDAAGCANPFCCNDVCRIDPWCCDVEWDRECVRLAADVCRTPPGNDQCYGDRSTARLVGPNTSTVFSNDWSSRSTTDARVSCHLGLQPECEGGSKDGEFCDFDFECPGGGVCPDRVVSPGAYAMGTVWFKFVAEDTSARLSLCQSDPGLDSVMQVFAVGDPTDDATSCRSLIEIGCSDDSVGCPDHGYPDPSCEPGRGGLCQARNHHAAACVQGLVPGDTYYVMVGSKDDRYTGMHQLDIESPCPAAGFPVPNDDCDRPAWLNRGFQNFDLARASRSLPDDVPSQEIDKDVWYRLGEVGGGWWSVETCGYTNELTPDTTMILYDDCECPPSEENIVGVSTDVGGACGLGSRLIVPSAPRNCYKLRLGDGAGDTAAGRLAVISVERPACPPMTITVRDEYQQGFIDPRRPHPASDASILEGIDRVVVAVDPLLGDVTLGEPEAIFDPSCWTVCETGHNVERHPPYLPQLHVNEVVQVNILDDPIFEVVLKRPITPGEATTLVYTDVNGHAQEVYRVTALPGDISGDGYAGAEDLILMIDHQCWFSARPGGGNRCPPMPKWGWDVLDINRGGSFEVTDLLELIDLLNGAGAYEPWMNASIGDAEAACP